MLNLTDVISKLQSDKVKTRQEALGLLEEAFSGSSTIANALGTNTREWLAVFRALFAAVTLEKATCSKKGFDKASAASLSRLERAGSTVRGIIRRSVPRLGTKVVRELLDHLMKHMTHRGRLVQTLSLNYVKSILEICSHRPHLEHLTTDMWISLCSLAFAVILEDSLSGHRGFGVDESDEPSDAEMDVEDDTQYSSAPSGSRKRMRSDSQPPQIGQSSGTQTHSTCTASPEQIDCMALLVVLLRSPYAPYTTPGISQKILNRLHRFFLKFSAWGNAHQAAVVATNVVLSQVELNYKSQIIDFALKMWPVFLSHWSMTRRSKAAKEEITLAMITFMPYITLLEVAEVSKNRVRECVEELYTCLEDDFRHTAGFEGLALDSLSLHLRHVDEKKNVFETDTLRSGFAFGSSQALTWATLELHADCVKALHIYSERFGSPVKRRKIESHISEIFKYFKNSSTPPKFRGYQLQLLLFVIERHWNTFHGSLQQEISSGLVDALAYDDPLVQSWTFLCLAAIAYAKDTVAAESLDWDAFWSHSVRRMNVPHVCRAASHTAHALLATQRLPVHRLLVDIEALSNDLTVQGPPFPHDSVCAFLCDCLRIASQDMRLHRLQLPDKVLSWISGSWNMAGPTRSVMPTHTVSDVVELLETTCSFTKTSRVPRQFLLPDCVTVKAAIERHRTADMREYTQHTRLPPFRPPKQSGIYPTTSGGIESKFVRFAPPTSREVKVSNFLYNSLDLLCMDLQNIKDYPLDSKPERIRRSLDAAIISLWFEGSMMRNGSQCTRRVIQQACKLVETITPCLEFPKWSVNERALILMGLEPLVFEKTQREDDPWDLLLSPTIGSGLKRNTLVKLADITKGNELTSPTPTRDVQYHLWQSVDVQETFGGILKSLRSVLVTLSRARLQSGTKFTEPDEGFTSEMGSPESRVQEFGGVHQLCIEFCMKFLATAPILQSGTANATRDKDLTDFILNSEPRAFLELFPEFLQVVRRKNMHLGLSTAEKFKDRINDLLTDNYDFTYSVETQMLAIQFMHSTSHIWMQPNAAKSDLADGVRLLNAWFAGMVLAGNLRSWRTRDRFICFLDHQISIDPLGTFWASDDLVQESEGGEDADGNNHPSEILPMMADDDDVRIRFRVAVANARLLSTAEVTQDDPMGVYARIKDKLSLETDEWEHMLTRFMHLGNAMVVSSAVRRGPYWHLLEVCLYTPFYNDAVLAVVSSVAERLGFPNLRGLFEAYASQLVESVIKSRKDFFGLPHALLGYADRRQCGRDTFPLLAPFIMTADDDPVESQYRKKMLEDHCHKAQKTVAEGLFECLPEMAGIRILQWQENHLDIGRPSSESSQTLLYQMYQVAIEADNSVEPQKLLQRNLDKITFAILKTVCDEDCSNDGPIIQALKIHGRSERAAATFTALAIHRKSDDVKMHRPNLPAFSSLIVLRSLEWLSQQIDGGVFTAPVIYHVLHHVFAAIGHSMLVNEQIRLLQALSIWVSINNSAFKDITLLRTLIRGAINVLAQFDLAHFAQGILQWGFLYCASAQLLVPNFPDLLGRIARIAHDYSREVNDSSLVSLGNELLDWIEKEARKLADAGSIKGQILSALPFWPRNPGRQLAQLAQEINQAEPLLEILRDKHVRPDKFRLVRRLRDFTDIGLYALDDFCKEDFWNIKECIPPLEEMQDEDIDAFLYILFKSAARIEPLRDEIESSTSITNLHRKASWKVDGRKPTFKVVPPHLPIVITLLYFLDADAPSQVYRAYVTLCHILALSIPELEVAHGYPSEFRKEFLYLASCPLPPMVSSPRSLRELQSLKSISAEFSRWVCDVSVLLNNVLAGNDKFYAQISPFIESDTVFAAQVLPILVHGLLLLRQDETRHCLSEYFRTVLLEETASLQTRKMIVEIVLHLRNFIPPRSQSDPLAYDKWLDIDYRLLSRGAIKCGAYTTALLFLELAADYSTSSPDEDSTTEEVLYDIYSHIEEPDGFYAIKSNDIRGFLTRRFHHEGQWDKAFQFHGADFAAGLHERHGMEGILQSLHSNGFNELAMAVLANSEATISYSSDLGYQIAWRTELWDLPEPSADKKASAIYKTLRAVHRDRDLRTVDTLLGIALRQEMSRLFATGIEDMVGIRERTRTILCLGEIKKWREESLQEKTATKDLDPTFWTEFIDRLPEFEFSTLESIITTRMSLLRLVRQHEQHEQIGDVERPFVSALKLLEQKCLVKLSEAARSSENHQIALNAIIHAQRLGGTSNFEVSQEFANVLWMQKEHKLAVEYLKNLASEDVQLGANDEPNAKYALILSRLGTWSAEACLLKPTDIREQYFHRATTTVLKHQSQANLPSTQATLAVVFHQYALFAEEQYHAILRSPEVSRLRLYVERKKHELEQIKESIGRTQSDTQKWRDLSNYQKKAQAIYGEDVAQFSVHTETRMTFLIQAIEMYSRCLQASDEFDDSAVIRLCSLWFANFQDDQVQPDFNSAIERVPSRKFIFLAHQLSARLSAPDSNVDVWKSQQHLQNLILRMCKEHPFHSIYQVWALQEGSPEKNRRQSSRGTTATQKSRARAAANILALCRQQPHNSERVQAIELLCKAYLEWAKYPLKPHKSSLQKGDLKVPSDLLLRKISKLPVPVTTAYTPVDLSLQYNNIVTIVNYAPGYTLAGGNNLPKINDCLGSDGRKYKQLFKGEGEDDLRQDAVMEQVFELVNVMLKRDRQTRKRQLSVRCYKVIPLAPQAGLLEFVENTMPIGHWLIPAHRRYRAGDMDHGACTSSLQNYRESRKGIVDSAGIREFYLKLLQRFRPVFRHFFTERHKLPTAWFATRLTYARSVATTSIVGHVLGLGDRHASNILIDKSTGELVHIDLGIAFDQGKYLPIPELVPFRLTPDIVDGLGISGTEGVFRRCAEETLRVLRAESGVITTVLEVFRHDPLHSWTASAIKIQRVQGTGGGTENAWVGGGGGSTAFGLDIDMASDTVDESADRALTSVHRKLDQSLSVEYTVNELIVTATDPTNLSQIFAGWSPCL